MALTKVEKRIRIKRRVRGKISGSAELPRLSVFKSNKCTYCSGNFHSFRRDKENSGRNVALLGF